ELSIDQRYILKELIETEDLRGKAMFARVYYAGCRASDVCWFQLDQVHHLTKKSGEITIGYKRGQLRTADDATVPSPKALCIMPLNCINLLPPSIIFTPRSAGMLSPFS